jgi:hypothetical protein
VKRKNKRKADPLFGQIKPRLRRCQWNCHTGAASGVFTDDTSRFRSILSSAVELSENFAVAVEEGATMIRIGTAIVGKRTK